MRKKVPVVTYILLPEFERKLSNKKRALEYRAMAKKSERALQKAKEENDKRLLKKRERYARKIVPFSCLQEKWLEKEKQEKAREVLLEEKIKKQKLEQANVEEKNDWANRMKKFRKEILHAGVRAEAKKLPFIFQHSEIGKAELLECEKSLVPVLTKVAKIVGFDVEVDDFEEMTALVLWRPYPYWHYAYSGKK
jgi:hypothetical protein